jgi:hypothetical protein
MPHPELQTEFALFSSGVSVGLWEIVQLELLDHRSMVGPSIEAHPYDGVLVQGTADAEF